MSNHKQPALIVHIIYSLGIGGLENGLVNLINRMPSDRYRHAIICLKNATEFRYRLQREDVEVYELNKRDGHDWRSFLTMYRLLRKLQPAIVHTRNLAALEYQVPAFLAGVDYRIHGEHGWDVFDPDGSKKKYQLLRKIVGLLVHRFIPLSKHLQAYLQFRVGIPEARIYRICNGVDTEKFYPVSAKTPLANCPLPFSTDCVYVGTVGRMHGVKDQTTLVKAFARMVAEHPELKRSARLILVGDGPLREVAIDFVQTRGLQSLVWLPGARDDIGDIMRNLDVFVLPSLAEGISNTILEAMASGLPVIATDVGGNSELVTDGVNGKLVEKGDVHAMADCIAYYCQNSDKRQLHGRNARQRVLEEFSMTAMVEKYMDVYNRKPSGPSN